MIEFILYIDASVVQNLSMIREPFFVQLFLTITEFAGTFAVIGITSIACVWLWQRRYQIYSLGLIIAVAGSEVTKAGLKILIERPRPVGNIPVFIDDGFSFPSGHAALAMALYGSLMFALWHVAKTNAQKFLILFTGTLIILGVGFSRLYLGLHYPSDVLSGYIVGAIWVALGMFIGRPLYAYFVSFSSKPKQTELRQ